MSPRGKKVSFGINIVFSCRLFISIALNRRRKKYIKEQYNLYFKKWSRYEITGRSKNTIRSYVNSKAGQDDIGTDMTPFVTTANAAAYRDLSQTIKTLACSLFFTDNAIPQSLERKWSSSLEKAVKKQKRIECVDVDVEVKEKDDDEAPIAPEEQQPTYEGN